jgi:hypothetical protein
MKLPRRQFLHLAAGAAALPVVSQIARAQTYPTRPVRIIVGYAPGGGTDIFVRLVGQSLPARLGQPFVIENRAGASSNIATEAVIRAPADGYTLLGTDAAAAINAALFDNLKLQLHPRYGLSWPEPRPPCGGGAPIRSRQNHSGVHDLYLSAKQIGHRWPCSSVCRHRLSISGPADFALWR